MRLRAEGGDPGHPWMSLEGLLHLPLGSPGPHHGRLLSRDAKPSLFPASLQLSWLHIKLGTQ